MGLISRVSSRTYRCLKILKLQKTMLSRQKILKSLKPSLQKSSTLRYNSSKTVTFGPHTIQKEYQIFYETSKSYGLCNTSPILPGHVLVCPKLQVQHVGDLPVEDLTDLMLAIQTVSSALKKYFNADALTINCQDGVAAGQTVPHVHFHILPRKFGDFKDKGEVYKKLRVHDKGREHELTKRSLHEMKEEAIEFRKLF